MGNLVSKYRASQASCFESTYRNYQDMCKNLQNWVRKNGNTNEAKGIAKAELEKAKVVYKEALTNIQANYNAIDPIDDRISSADISYHIEGLANHYLNLEIVLSNPSLKSQPLTSPLPKIDNIAHAYLKTQNTCYKATIKNFTSLCDRIKDYLRGTKPGSREQVRAGIELREAIDRYAKAITNIQNNANVFLHGTGQSDRVTNHMTLEDNKEALKKIAIKAKLSESLFELPQVGAFKKEGENFKVAAKEKVDLLKRDPTRKNEVKEWLTQEMQATGQRFLSIKAEASKANFEKPSPELKEIQNTNIQDHIEQLVKDVGLGDLLSGEYEEVLSSTQENIGERAEKIKSEYDLFVSECRQKLKNTNKTYGQLIQFRKEVIEREKDFDQRLTSLIEESKKLNLRHDQFTREWARTSNLANYKVQVKQGLNLIKDDINSESRKFW